MHFLGSEGWGERTAEEMERGDQSGRERERESREMEWEFAMMEGGLLLREVLRWSYAYSMSDQKSSAGTREEVGAALKRAERGQQKKLLAPGSSL